MWYANTLEGLVFYTPMKDFKLSVEGQATDNVTRIFVVLVTIILGTTGVYGWKNLSATVEGLNQQVTSLRDRNVDQTILLFEVKSAIDNAANSSREPTKTTLKSASQKIEESLRKWKEEDKKLFAFPQYPPPTQAPIFKD